MYFSFSSCKKDVFTVDSSSSITLSADTMWFDTVFTRINSTTPKSVNKQFVVRNPNDKSIRTSIALAGGSSSHFRLNVDGEPGTQFTDIEIFPNDSVFCFVEVHPDPNNNNPSFNPLIIRDSILFETNGNEDKINLIGWGQDAHYIFRDSIETDTTWANSNLPIVVYGYCYVKPGVTLKINKGMKVHFAPYSWLFVEGTVNIVGTKDEPILMQGDRLQPDWEEEPAQWGGIFINEPSSGNFIEHALIKNGTVGVFCDSMNDAFSVPHVTISKTMIRNMQSDGVAGKHAYIKMENSVSTNCGRFTFLGSFGGRYDIRNSTFYTGNRDFGRSEPTFAFLNRNRDQFGQILGTYDIQFYFVNNIIDGSRSDGEIGNDLDSDQVISPSIIDYNLLNSTDAQYFGSSSNFTGESNFIDAFNFNFDLDTLSAAKDKGFILTPPITDDFCNRPRDAMPDVGAFESQF